MKSQVKINGFNKKSICHSLGNPIQYHNINTRSQIILKWWDSLQLGGVVTTTYHYHGPYGVCDNRKSVITNPRQGVRCGDSV